MYRDPVERALARKASRDKFRLRRPHLGHARSLMTRGSRAPGDVTQEALEAWIAIHKGCPCAYCGQPALTVDHKIPLSRGGRHEWSNLQWLCRWCNIAKNDQTEEEFFWRLDLIAERRK